MRTNRKRTPLPFLFRAADGLGPDRKLIARAYGNVVEGVFTRAGAALGIDDNKRLVPTPHSLPRFGVAAGAPALILEGATTNYLLRSQEFDNASWVKTNITVTANAVVAPDGTTTADKVEATASAATTFRQVETTIATTEATFSVYGAIGSGATDANRFILWNNTLSSVVAGCTINWTTGVVSTSAGTCRSENAGVHNGVQWWRIVLTAAAGITSGDDLACYPCFDGQAETANEYAYLWGAQLEALPSATSYVATTTATVSRVADALYFPFTLTPRAMTAYVRMIDNGQSFVSAVAYPMMIGSATPAAASWGMATTAAATGQHLYYLVTSAGAQSGSSATNLTASNVGSVVEYRITLTALGVTQIHQSIALGTEESSGTATRALDATWNATRLNLATGGAASYRITHVAVADGSKTLSEMRDLVEV